MKLKTVLKRSFLMLVTAFIFGFVTSCKNDGDDVSEANDTHKVIFKAEASSGSNISTAVYGIDGNPITVNGLSGTTWMSPEITTDTKVYNSNVVVNATGANSASTLKVQIWVDGELKKESTVTGKNLSASTSYSF
ncbi:hypothetical protein [Chryseobacterium sp. GP-SGM7]|uniref:hypothetical protein n=1 Tax=Chryseobacterium sp. GP-SGM7 TaxID=3411323 RepID=UPI003B964981